jgi:capsular polysaccharide biosynthesis protein
MELTFRDYLRLLRKRIWLIAAIAAAATGIAAYVGYCVIKPVYAASAKLIVSEAGAPEPSGLNSDAIRSNILLVSTYKEIIKSPAILDKVIAQNPGFALTEEELMRAVDVSSVNDTQVINVTVEDASAERAAAIVNGITATFKSQVPQIMKVDNVTILNQAKADPRQQPVKPRPLLYVVMAFVVSLMAGAGLALLLETLNDKFTAEEELERYLQLPALGTIPKLRRSHYRRTKPEKSMSKLGEAPYAHVNQ